MRMVFPIFLKLQCNIPKLRKTCSLPSWQPHHRNASGHLSPVPLLHVPHLQTQGLTLPTKHKASHMSEGRLAGLKTLLTKHVPMGISQRVYFTGITYFHLFVPFLLFGFFFFFNSSSLSRPYKKPDQFPSSLLAQILVPVPGLARCLLLSVGRGSGPVLQMLLM